MALDFVLGRGMIGQWLFKAVLYRDNHFIESHFYHQECYNVVKQWFFPLDMFLTDF